MHYKEYFQIGVKATSRYHQKLEKSSLNIWSLSFIIHLNLFQTKTSLILYNKSFHLFDVFLPYKIILSFLLAVVITYIARIWLTITSQLSSLIASSDVENNKLAKALPPAATSPIKDCRPPWSMVLHYIKRGLMKEKRRKDDCRSTVSSLTNPFISCPY